MKAGGGRWTVGEALGLCAILVLAAWLRLHRLDQAEFQWDQAEISKWALELGQEGTFRWIGPVSSTGIDTFPAAIWLYAIPYSLSTSPVVATGFVALLNVAAVVGCYMLTRRWFGIPAAFVATGLYASATWAVLYSRKIWHTVLLPPLVLLYVWTGWMGFARGRRAGLVLHGLALAILVQTHFSSYPFIVLTLLWAVVFWRRIEWKAVPLAGLAAGLPFAPYLLYDAQRDWRNLRRLSQAGVASGASGGEALRNAWIAVTGYGLELVTGPDRYREFLVQTPNARWLFGALGVLVGASTLVAIARAISRARDGMDEKTSAAIMVASWALVPVLVLSRGFTWPAPHYFTILYPAPFMLVGYLLMAPEDVLNGHRRVAFASAAIVLLVAIAVAQTLETVSLLRFVWVHDTVLGYGTPLRTELVAARTARSLVGSSSGGEVILLSEGDEPRSFEMPNVADILLYRTPHRAVDIRSALVVPASPAVYWATYERTYGERVLARLTPEMTDERVWLREGRRSYRFYRWPGGPPVLPRAGWQSVDSAEWANGARLESYAFSGDLSPGSTVRWTLVWRPQRTLSEDVYYHWFNHLLDVDGTLVAQKDGPSLLPAAWRPGDTILNWYTLEIPLDGRDGPYAMRVGMYEYPSLERVKIVSQAAGQDWVLIGPLGSSGTSVGIEPR